MHHKKLIFISGPYTGNEINNTREMILTFHVLLDMGFVPFCPLFTAFAELIRPRPYDEWMELDKELISVCDAMLKIGDSPGADEEERYAKELGIPVLYSLKELEDWEQMFEAGY